LEGPEVQDTVKSSAGGGSSSFTFSFPSVASYSSNTTASSALPRDPGPSGAIFSSAAPQGLLQLASIALDTRSCGEARSAGLAFTHKTFAPLAAQSYSDSLTRGSICTGVPIPEGRPTPGACGGKQGDVGQSSVETGPPREISCVEAVMEHLERGCPISEADVESIVDD
jgi:hypothetical protein